MEISLHGWLIIGGTLIVALILFDGWRRIRANRDRIRLKIDPTVVGNDTGEEDPLQANPELPNGGARRRNAEGATRAAAAKSASSAATERREPVFGQPASGTPGASRTPGAQAPASHSDELPLDPDSLRDMDPLFDDVPVDPAPRRRKRAAGSGPAREEDALDRAISQGEFDGLSLDDLETGDTAQDTRDSIAGARPERPETEAFDPEQPIPVLRDRIPGSDAGKASSLSLEEGAELDAHALAADGLGLDLNEQAPLAPEPAEEKPSEASAEPAAAEAATAERKRPAPEISTNPEEMLVIFVVGRDKAPLPGAAIRKIVEACGMEFSELGIYHRHEKPNATGPLQFSMANAVEPGTFDLATIDSMETPAVTFFMSMRDPADPLYAFECMLATADTLCRHLDAELLDGDRSVMRPQTQEHYRERIRDFEIHKRVKRSP